MKVAVAFETDAFAFTFMFVTSLETHIMTETYAFLHTPPVLANCRQSMWGNSGVFSKKSCLMCRLDAYFVGSLSMLVLLFKCLNSLLTVYKMKSQVKYLRVIFQILSMSDSFFFLFFLLLCNTLCPLGSGCSM